MFERAFIIAEAGMNHNGSLDTALEMVHKAREAGADAIKFQDISMEGLFSIEHYKRALGLKDDEWLKKISGLAFKPDWHRIISKEAESAGIIFFATPFSLESVERMNEFVPFFKVASCDITFYPLLDRIASKGKGVFLSTGASTFEEIDSAVKRLRSRALPFVCVMHCVMLYPAPPPALNLNYLSALSERYGSPVGFSDHSPGADAAVVAVAKGALALEKHFTLDRAMEGPDHKNSLPPPEFAGLVRRVRFCEEMLGSAERAISEAEAKERVFARRGIYAKNDLKKGELLTLENVAFLRPKTAAGAGAEEIECFLGKTLLVDVPGGTPLDLTMV